MTGGMLPLLTRRGDAFRMVMLVRVAQTFNNCRRIIQTEVLTISRLITRLSVNAKKSHIKAAEIKVG